VVSDSESKTATARVRILVMIDPKGHWEATGSASFNDQTARENLDEFCGDMGIPPWGYHWIEADLPLPIFEQKKAVQGIVTDAE
jgi:hypothetical protein